jgi:predicted nucleic acid-binding protein
MNEGLVISDAGPIFSLAIIDKPSVLEEIFGEIVIPKAVWEKVAKDKETGYYHRVADFFKDRVRAISGFNELTFVMDYGESESVILYRELNANYLLIDDKKARRLEENFGINCIGTVGVPL